MKKIIGFLIIMVLILGGCSSAGMTSNKTPEEPKVNDQQEQNNQQDQGYEKEKNNGTKEGNNTPEYVSGHKILECNLESEGATKAIVIKMDGTYDNIEGSITDFDGDCVFHMDTKYYNTMESLTYTDEITGEDYAFTPPEGYIGIDESYFKSIVGEDLFNKIAMGEEVKATCNISNYAYYYVFDSELFITANMEIVEFEESKEKEASKLLNFSQIYDGNNLVEPLEYLDENFDSFSNDEKTTFAKEYISAYRKKIASYDLEVLGELTNDSPIYGPVAALDADDYYSYYSMKDSTIDVDLLPGEIDRVINFIEQEEFLILTAYFWASEGYVTMGDFSAILNPTYTDSFNRIQKIANKDIVEDCLLWENIKDKFTPDFVSGEVIVIDNPENLELFEHKDIWKTNVYLPIKNIIGIIDYSDVDESIYKKTEFDTTVLEGFTNETIYGEYIDFSKYSAIAAEMYVGDNLESLESHEVSINDSTTSMYSIALFGQYENIKIYFYEDMNSQEDPEIIDVESITNGNIIIAANVIPSVSRVRVDADVIERYGEDHSITFNLYDDTNPEDYSVSTWE